MEPLLKTIQARKLDRVAAAYAIGGWLLVQVASIAFPAFDLPAWTLRAFIIFVVAGFPAALALTWFAAPHIQSSDVAARPIARGRLAAFAAVAVVLLLSAGELAYKLSGVSAPPSAPAVPQEASIAILPFDNMSGDDHKEYFSDGVSEEILNDLANVPSLRVAARASSFAFKGKNTDVKTIARLLSVRTILQGSVRESGEHIRITAELINALDGFLIWSSTFDRNMTDVLTVQDDIARAITSSLTHTLFPHSVKPHRQSINAEAYRDYLLGQFYLGPRTADGAAKALALFKTATALQPDFAEGFAALGRAYINVSEDNPSDKTLIPAAQAALSRALQLAPDNLNALASHLDLSLHLLDWNAAMQDAARMRKINPNSVVVLHEMFRFYQLMGFPERALASARGAAQLDPLSVVDRLNTVAALLHMARYDEAATAAQAALSLHREQPFIHSMLCTAYAHSNRVAEARQMADGFARASDMGDADGCRFDIAIGTGAPEDAIAIMDRLSALYPKGDLSATDFGDNYAIAGDTGKAFMWLNRAYDAKEFALFTIPFDKAIAPKFFDEPGWKALWQKPLAQDWQKAHDSIAANFATANN